MTKRNSGTDEAADVTVGTGSHDRNDVQRLTVNLNGASAQALREYREETNASATEAIRRALAVLKYVHEAQSRGATITVSDGRESKEVVFIA
jgi:hypothetical protein